VAGSLLALSIEKLSYSASSNSSRQREEGAHPKDGKVGHREGARASGKVGEAKVLLF